MAGEKKFDRFDAEDWDDMEDGMKNMRMIRVITKGLPSPERMHREFGKLRNS